MDDSHACIDSIKNAFSMSIERESPLFQRLLEIFKGSLTEQGEGDFYKILATDSCSFYYGCTILGLDKKERRSSADAYRKRRFRS